MTFSTEGLVQEITYPLGDLDFPPDLQIRVERHRNELAALAKALIDCGHDEATVRGSLETVFSSYQDELIRTITAIGEDVHAKSLQG